MGYSGANEEQIQWAFIEAGGYKVPNDRAIGIAATELTRMIEQEGDLTHADMLVIQRDLLVQAGRELPAASGNEEPYLDISPMTLREFEASKPQPSPVAETAAKIAVEALFSPKGVTLTEDTSVNKVPYIKRIGQNQERAVLLAATRRIVSFAVLGSPGETFRRADIKEIAGWSTSRGWPRMFELLENWWAAQLTIDGRPLIVPAHDKPGHGIRVDPMFNVTRQWRAGRKPQRMI